MNSRWAPVRFWAFVTFIVLCFCFGGSSQPAVLSPALLYPMAALLMGLCLLTPGDQDWRSQGVPMALLAMFGAVMAGQLVPIPFELWAELPGRAPFAAGMQMVGAPAWHAISIQPDETVRSLMALIIPAAILVGFASIQSEHMPRMVTVLTALILISALLGILQVLSGPRGGFYLFRVANTDTAVGFFANRNHQAALLAMAWPLLALWATMPQGRTGIPRRTLALAAAAMLVPLMLITGSRAGLIVGAAGLLAAGIILWMARRGDRSSAERMPVPFMRHRRLLNIAAPLVILVAGVSALLFSKAPALDRLVSTNLADEDRYRTFPQIFAMAQDFAPVGAGFGTFPAVYRTYEADANLGPLYLNHAHNDFLELIIAGGIPAVIVVVVAAIWAAVALVRTLRGGDRFAKRCALTACAMLAIQFMASLSDYPLRTPLQGAVFAVAVGLLAFGARRRRRSG